MGAAAAAAILKVLIRVQRRVFFMFVQSPVKILRYISKEYVGSTFLPRYFLLANVGFDLVVTLIR